MKRVLVLDNDQDILDIMNEVLTYEGFRITCISKADSIFKEIATHKPDLLMVDYLLNGISGGEVCRRIKENSQTHNLPIIVISAYPRLGMSLGANDFDDFISKPFDLDDLVNRIKKLLRKKTNGHMPVI